jgi:hypothetical protein
MADWNNCMQHNTPKKAKIQGTLEYLEAKYIPHFKQDVFDHFQVSHRQGWAMISEASKDRRHHRTESLERRGRPRVITNQELKEMNKIIKSEDFEARELSWQELAWDAGIEGVSTRTTSRVMGESMNYHKCIACQKK